MPRSPTLSNAELVQRTLLQFWGRSYDGIGMEDLVRGVGVSRHGFYAAFGSKRAAYLACFDEYDARVVTPAFAPVEAPGAGLDAIAAYFEAQIALAERCGLPGPGCFVANAAAELEAEDTEVRAKLTAHRERLIAGLAQVLDHVGHPVPAAAALHTMIFAQGLWTLSRTVQTAAPLRQAARLHITQLEDACP